MSSSIDSNIINIAVGITKNFYAMINLHFKKKDKESYSAYLKINCNISILGRKL